MSAALLLNPDLKVPSWQLKCINNIVNEVRVIYIPIKQAQVYRSRSSRKLIKYIFYYLLNLKSIRQKKVPLDSALVSSVKVRYLEYTLNQKGWAEFNSKSIEQILNDSPEYIYKCGLSLLSVPGELEKVPIISHHHGDPSRYRGRPAGFYEILNNETSMGQIVQVLSNRLDAGRILAFGESKISKWSYKQTLRNSYEVSPYLLQSAIRNLRENKSLCVDTEGKNYRLPSNAIVSRFVIRLLFEKIKRFIYGAFFEKKWNIAVSENPEGHILDPWGLLQYIQSEPKGDRRVLIDKKHTFYADPFILGKNIVVEALRASDGIGELLELDAIQFGIAQTIRPDFAKQRHVSYPYVLGEGSETYLYPDSAEYERPFVLRRNEWRNDYFETLELTNIPVASGITDPSVFAFEGKYYMFGNLRGESSMLRLWIGDDCMFSNAIEHPLSPVRFGPKGSRSGGKIFVNHDQIFRIAQDFSYGYGDGLLLFRISRITPSDFQEDLIGEIKFDLLHGPHTFDANDKLLCWDYYCEKFSLFAGYRRLVAAAKSRIRVL